MEFFGQLVSFIVLMYVAFHLVFSGMLMFGLTSAFSGDWVENVVASIFLVVGLVVTYIAFQIAPFSINLN